MYAGDVSRLQFPMKISTMDRRIGLYWAAALVADQNLSRHFRASAGPPRAMPSASATAFMAPALVPLTACDAKPLVLEELVEYAPGKGAMRAAALQGKFDRLLGPLRHPKSPEPSLAPQPRASKVLCDLMPGHQSPNARRTQFPLSVFGACRCGQPDSKMWSVRPPRSPYQRKPPLRRQHSSQKAPLPIPAPRVHAASNRTVV